MTAWEFNIDSYIGHVTLPHVCTIRQKFNDAHITDLDAHLLPQYRAQLDGVELEGKRVAITAGSRGINGLLECIRSLVAVLKEKGAYPFLFPAMGSHAGATAQGQEDYIVSLGITPEAVGAPIISDMNTVLIDSLDDGTPIYIDSVAHKADGIIVINKIKPHANFKGDIESGLCKMLVIGMGKREGAALLHSKGYDVFPAKLAQISHRILLKANVLFAVGIVENSYDTPMIAEVIPKNQIIERERELLTIAKKNIPSIQAEQVDVLIVDEIGKNISGQGMDPNVTGRTGSPVKEGFNQSFVDKITVLRLTQQTHGNFIGLGMADISTIDAVRNLDFKTTYINEITSRTLPPARLPFLAGNDEQAVKLAVYTSKAYPTGDIGLVHIKNTNQLETIQVSRKILRQLKKGTYEFTEGTQPVWRNLQFTNGRLEAL